MLKNNVKLNSENESSIGYNKLQETENLIKYAMKELQKEERKNSLQQCQIKTKNTGKKDMER